MFLKGTAITSSQKGGQVQQLQSSLSWYLLFQTLILGSGYRPKHSNPVLWFVMSLRPFDGFVSFICCFPGVILKDLLHHVLSQ